MSWFVLERNDQWHGISMPVLGRAFSRLQGKRSDIGFGNSVRWSLQSCADKGWRFVMPIHIGVRIVCVVLRDGRCHEKYPV